MEVDNDLEMFPIPFPPFKSSKVETFKMAGKRVLGNGQRGIVFVDKILDPLLPCIKANLTSLAHLNVTYFDLEKHGPVPFLKLRREAEIRLTWFNGGFTFSYIFLTSVYFLLTLSYNKSHEKIMGFCFIICWITCSMMYIELWRKRESFCALFNSMLRFELQSSTSHCQKGKSDTNKGPLLVLQTCFILVKVTRIGIPVFLALVLIGHPCIPPHVGYAFFKQSNGSCISGGLIMQMSLILPDVAIWMLTFPHGIFYAVAIILVIVWLNVYLGLLGRLVRSKRGWSMIWNRRAVATYRQLQLIEVLFNSTYREIFLPIIMMGALTAAIVALFACIKLRSTIPLFGTLLFGLIGCDGLSMIFATEIASHAFTKSKYVLDSLRNTNGKLSRMDRKNLASIQEVKIRFGGNFIDNITPLTFLHFWLSTTATLMVFMDANNK